MKQQHASGTTLIELISVLLLISIVSAFILIRYNDDSDLVVETEMLKANIRHVQLLALSAENHTWKIKFKADGTAYTLHQDDSILPADSAFFPADTSSTRALPDNIHITASPVPEIAFDKFGSIQGLTEDFIIILKKSTGSNKTLTLNRTGFIDDSS